MTLLPFVFEFGPLEVNLFIMVNETTSEGILVDAGICDPSVLECVTREGIQIAAILLTHHHPDHVVGLAEYLEKWICQVFSPAPIPSAPGAKIVSEGATILAAGFEFRVLKTSGHTPESVSYYCAKESVCFVGDAVLAGAVGGTPDDELHAEEIGNLRRSVLILPPETELYSGHGPMTTVAIEKAANPFLQAGFKRTA